MIPYNMLNNMFVLKMRLLTLCVYKCQFTALFNIVYHIDLQVCVAQHVYQYKISPSKHADD